MNTMQTTRFTKL